MNLPIVAFLVAFAAVNTVLAFKVTTFRNHLTGGTIPRWRGQLALLCSAAMCLAMAILFLFKA